MANNPNPINQNNIDDAQEYLKALLDITDVSRNITQEFERLLKVSNESKLTQASILGINKKISRMIFDQSDNLIRLLDNEKSTLDIQKDILKGKNLIIAADKEQEILNEKKIKLEVQQQQAFSRGDTARFDQITDQIMLYDKINKKLTDQQKLLTENITINEEALTISKKADNAGFKFVESAVKSIPGLKAFGSTFEKATLAARGANLKGESGLGAGLKELIGPLTKGAFIFGAIATAIKFIVDAMFGASKLTAQFKRDFIVSSEEAEKVRQRTYDIATNSKNLADTEGKILITQTQIVKSLEQANQALGVQMDLTSELGKFGEKLLVQTAILRDNFGLTEEAIAGVTQESIRTGKETEKITKRTLGNVAAIFLGKKQQGDYNKILNEAYKTAGVLRLSFKGSSEEIAKGISKLQLMGLTLQDTQKVAAGLLDFESSISAQIEAELLTGKQINVEKARLLAMNRDFVGVGEELVKQGITYNYLQTLNATQLEAQAKVYNLTGEELSDIIKKQEESNALTERARRGGIIIKDINKQSLAELYEANKKLGKSEQDLADVLGEEIYKKKQSEDAQAQFNKALEKAKDIFSRLVDSGALDKLANGIISFVGAVDAFMGSQGLKKQVLGETSKVTSDKSILGTGLMRETETVSEDGRVKLQEGRPFGFLGETLGDMFKFARLEKDGQKIGSSFGQEGFKELLEQQKQTNELLKQQANKPPTKLYMDSNAVSTTQGQSSYVLGG
jgi:hypothetical protein